MPLALRRDLDRDTRLAVWHITEPAEKLGQGLVLDRRQQAALARMRPCRRRHWLAGRALLRELLGDAAVGDCLKDINGKPRLAGATTSISLAHSFDYAAAMTGERGAVGVDVELIRPEVLEIAGLFMTANELAPIRDPDRIGKLCACWCAKEAVFKLKGRAGVPAKRMTIRRFAYRDRGTMRVDLDAPHRKDRFLVRYERFRGYMLAWTAER